MRGLKTALLLCVVGVLSLPTAGVASTVTIVDESNCCSPPPDDNGQTLGTLSVTGLFSGLNVNGSGQVVAVDLANANLTTATAELNTLIGGSVTGGSQSGTFQTSTDATYFAIKIGEDTAFFHNTSGGTLTALLYTEAPGGAGAGFSTFYAWGGTPVINTPLPGALPLFASGLVGLGLLMRKRRKQLAA